RDHDDLPSFPTRRSSDLQALDPDELAELARLKVPLVRLRGQWVELDDAHLKAALKFLERNQAGTMTAADALTAGMGLGPGGPERSEEHTSELQSRSELVC